jgi:bifunctional non-homologous end joining protein LigD
LLKQGVSSFSRFGFIPPQLASSVDQPPQGSKWIHEVKHDGCRTILVIERGSARAYTRNGHDTSDRYPGIIVAARKLPCRAAILDGEVIVQDSTGVSDDRDRKTGAQRALLAKSERG